MKLEYKQNGDYKLPNLEIKNNTIKGKINRFGLLRLEYIKNNKKSLYTTLLMKNELNNYLVSVSNEAEIMFNNIMNDYINNDIKLSEKNKSENQLEWTKLMNNYKQSAEEIIKKELIYI